MTTLEKKQSQSPAAEQETPSPPKSNSPASYAVANVSTPVPQPELKEEPLEPWEIFLLKEKDDFQRWIDASEWTKWETTKAGTDLCYTLKGKGDAPALWCRQEFENTTADSETVIKALHYMVTSGYAEKHDPNLKELKWLAKSKCKTREVKYKHLALPWPLYDRLMVPANVTELDDKHMISWGVSVHDWFKQIPKRTVHGFLRSRHSIFEIGPGRYRYEWIAQVDPNGIIPMRVMLWAKGHVSKQVTKTIRIIARSDFSNGIGDVQKTLKDEGIDGFQDLWKGNGL